MEEQPGKTVGRIRPAAEQYDKLVQASRELMPRLPFPKGVYRFRSFEEANAWTEKHILEAAIRKHRALQSGPT